MLVAAVSRRPEQAPPKPASQPGRVRVSYTPEFRRSFKSKVAARRPRCLDCHQIAPAPDMPRDDWAEHYGHCRPLTDEQRAKGWRRGEPCHGNVVLPGVYAARMAELAPPVVETLLLPVGNLYQTLLFTFPVSANVPRRPRVKRVPRPKREPLQQETLFELMDRLAAEH